ncbi:hypothetical protein B5V46_04675 [Rhodovulum sp. MB263]|nr:hypothetical protein B5V46_04675 [Rhodovulum sp. MB263]
MPPSWIGIDPFFRLVRFPIGRAALRISPPEGGQVVMLLVEHAQAWRRPRPQDEPDILRRSTESVQISADRLFR